MKIDRRSFLGAAVIGLPAIALPGLTAAAATPPPGAVPMAAWPHQFTENGARVTIYEPQAIDWPNHATLSARAAIAITPIGRTTPIMGTIEFSGATEVDTDNNLVYFTNPTLISSSFPALDTSQAYTLQTRIAAFLTLMPPKIIPLNTVLLSLNEKPAAAGPPLNNNPPVIFYSAQPASLVVFDGEPTMAPIASTGLTYAVNTNWDVIQDQANGGAWYLLNNGIWLVAQAYTGPYQPAGPLPAAFSKIPNDANFGEIRRNVPGKPPTAGLVPIIFISTKPAEIIVTAGAPTFTPVPQTSLQAVTNSGAVLFRYTPTNSFYYLVSGRWFTASSLYGPWTFATPSLPPDFSRLSPDGTYGNLLASVPGTTAAQAAVLKAQVPTRATLPRSTTKVAVTYAGAPNFAPIPGTAMTYATNTAFQVIGTAGQYYCCYQGAWFVASAPTGPWMLATAVPAVIYTIPPSSPVYNVTYVQVYGSTTAAVTYGYTAGYMMGFITAGILAYGTGYYYPPYVAYGHVPVYYPYAYTYAGNVHYNTATGAWASTGTVYGAYGRTATAGYGYNPSTGTYARGAAVYGPYGGAAAGSRYNPSTGAYAHGSAVWGNGSASAHAYGYNPSTGMAGSTTQNANAYGRWGSSSVSGPNGSVNTASASNARGTAGAFNASNGAQGAAVHTNNGNNAGAVKTANGNVYAGSDGNVYQHNSSGWSKYNSGSWQQMQKPTQQSAQANHSTYQRPTTSSQNWGQLNRDQTARQYGGYNRGSYGGAGGGTRRRW
ncbi:hypothetical protein ACELLULO517_05710 [Acidisoma cellulosilytica]|uniref:Uncharacterized protein n=1 Tax=Acidisoma cellulosilyticum TaxID=2802395 RepID=A0A964E2S4_9PROT|nr:hypothetical protein [Acidisoma cellulosilyticum]MCB8879721.1 hypothetical protein [Acidisoma cellulosilyticum]